MSNATSPATVADPVAGGRQANRLAVIDDDSGFLLVLGNRLQSAGWQHTVLSSQVPLDTLAAQRLTAVVLDLNVLGIDAWSYLEQLCARLPHVGVVVCCGPSTVAQRVRGLRLGADDWINKPCHPEELIARVEAVVRRRRCAAPAVREPAVLAGELEIRADHFQVFAAGASAELTRREFELIRLLSATPGRVLEREDIYQRVWGYAMVHGDRSVDVFVRKLRQKLERASPQWRYIHTHFGIGYRFDPQPVDGGLAVETPQGVPAGKIVAIALAGAGSGDDESASVEQSSAVAADLALLASPT